MHAHCMEFLVHRKAVAVGKKTVSYNVKSKLSNNLQPEENYHSVAMHTSNAHGV